MKAFITTIACLASLAGLTLAQAQTDLHTPWDQVLGAYVAESDDGVNRFDYAGLRANSNDRAALTAYIERLEATQVSALTDDERFAFWANLYNAVTVRLIVDEAPENSIRQIRPRPWSIGPWGVNRVEVEGRALSLDDIEHRIMRVEFEAPLVHYAVNCASIGCPNLMARAWRGATLEADLEAGARAYINHPRGVTVTEDGLVVSRIYDWFNEDFGGSDAGVIAHVLRYAEPDLAQRIDSDMRINSYIYDWSLNRTESS
ncbi:DUF547 domain-containing protein [Oceanicaulis alexandrii]|uniref:DUF547 domain-containing protein n=1 Tax=Oceanicaulis alexandrii TaxID=153233 RepID=UPI0035CEB4F3